MIPLIITCAAIGAELSKKHTPFVPLTPEEIIQEASAVAALGAQVFHLHVRDGEGKPTCNPKLIKKIVSAIKKQTGLILQVSTGGAIGDSARDRLGTLNTAADMGSLTLGSVNFGNEVFLNPVPLIEKLAGKMQKLGIKPELEIFDAGMVEQAHKLCHQGLLTPPHHFNIILGGPGWLPATIENLDFILKKLPDNSTWSASGIGRNQLPMINYAIAHGGHVRTGLEDNIFIKKGVLAKGNQELVAQCVECCNKFRRPLATIAEARKILGVK